MYAPVAGTEVVATGAVVVLAVEVVVLVVVAGAVVAGLAVAVAGFVVVGGALDDAVVVLGVPVGFGVELDVAGFAAGVVVVAAGAVVGAVSVADAAVAGAAELDAAGSAIVLAASVVFVAGSVVPVPVADGSVDPVVVGSEVAAGFTSVVETEGVLVINHAPPPSAATPAHTRPSKTTTAMPIIQPLPPDSGGCSPSPGS